MRRPSTWEDSPSARFRALSQRIDDLQRHCILNPALHDASLVKVRVIGEMLLQWVCYERKMPGDGKDNERMFHQLVSSLEAPRDVIAQFGVLQLNGNYAAHPNPMQYGMRTLAPILVALHVVSSWYVESFLGADPSSLPKWPEAARNSLLVWGSDPWTVIIREWDLIQDVAAFSEATRDAVGTAIRRGDIGALDRSLKSGMVQVQKWSGAEAAAVRRVQGSIGRMFSAVSIVSRAH